ncbi:MAG: hypothetical protein ACW98D_04705 [Promethearchaeota archaeon]|jgi:hypothetical protein
MRDKRAIIIKSLKLRKLRNAFRDVFFQAARLKRKEYYKEWRNFLINPDGTRRSINDLTPDELKRLRLLQEQESHVTDMINRSILMCMTCGKDDRDMVYNKAYNSWYCTSCYRMEANNAKELKQKRAKSGGKPKGHEDKAVESHFKTFL